MFVLYAGWVRVEDRFRGEFAPASLKRSEVQEFTALITRFRGEFAPASLKLVPADHRGDEADRIPGRIRPGLIEAGHETPASGPCPMMIPGRIRPGLIEAVL